jgi:hypothetical protein
VQDLDTPSYDSPESLASASLQDAQPAEQVDPRNFHWKENLSSKSPIASFLHPTLPNPKQQALSRDEDHEEEQIIRTALSLLGYKVTGKVVLGADVNELARSIVGPLEVSDEQIIRAALAVLGEKMTGKKEDVRDLANRIISEREDVRDLANRIIGDGPSSWNPSTYSSNGPRANSTLPVLTENSPGSQSFGPNPTMQLPDDSGYGTTRTSTQTPVHDPHEFNFDLLDELTALAQSASRAEESQGSSSDSSGGNFFETTDWEITTPVARPTSIPPAPRLKSLPPPPRLKSMWPLLKCRVCHKTVESMSELKYIPKYLMTIRSNTDRKHHLRHRRPFLCPITGCPRKDDGFSTTNDLDRHKISEHPSSFDLTHTKRYQCHVPGCRSISRGTVWPRLDKFRSHLKRLHSEIIRSEEDFDEFVRRYVEFAQNNFHSTQRFLTASLAPSSTRMGP